MDTPFTIWLDADGAPGAVKEVLLRAAERRAVPLVLVANRPQRVPPSRWIRTVQVGAGLDVADDHIAAQCQPGDLVVTGDIPLAAEAVENGAIALDFRGDLLTLENVRQRLNMRDFMQEMRASGLAGGGPAAFGPRDKQRFANALDRFLTTQERGGG